MKDNIIFFVSKKFSNMKKKLCGRYFFGWGREEEMLGDVEVLV